MKKYRLYRDPKDTAAGEEEVKDEAVAEGGEGAEAGDTVAAD